ncbi:MAG: protoheme IX farnesyltransferase [Candidatus Neomarinimicrobiota bacterium]|nr:MAG: protoheme IX farnesyltransferase [Candidatus Neomarinimicrobiota bacterium]
MRREPQKASSIKEAYYELTKPSITFMILVSTALGYFMGGNGISNYQHFILTLLGSCLISSGSGALNHFAEAESDKIMHRTNLRPIPAGIILPENAMIFGIALIFIGSGILYFFINTLTCVLALITALMYLFIYTPLKKLTWLNTPVGAIPGAIPPIGGWVAATGSLDAEAWILFAILFLWQHPHFYAIALMFKDDYKKAGLKMLPVVEPNGSRTNRQIIWHALLLIPVSVMPVYINLLGMIYFWAALILGIGYLLSGFILAKQYSVNNARLVLKVSVFYLPILFLTIMVDKLT